MFIYQSQLLLFPCLYIALFSLKVLVSVMSHAIFVSLDLVALFLWPSKMSHLIQEEFLLVFAMLIPFI